MAHRPKVLHDAEIYRVMHMPMKMIGTLRQRIAKFGLAASIFLVSDLS